MKHKKFTNVEKITYFFIILMFVINPIGLAVFSNFEKNENEIGEKGIIELTDVA